MTEFKLPELGENIEQGELVRLMMDHDLELARQEQTLAAAGHKVVQRGVSQY